MKKMLVKTLITSICISSVLCFTGCGKNVSRETYNLENIYSNLMLVKECCYNPDGTATIQLINCNGFVFGYKTEDQDVCLNDCYSVVFYDNETPYVYDDIIIDLRYDRPDLLLQYI